ncbi:MAG TPA: PilZ domain-containing protein [Candidatus Baltobacteraceae bacterium]|nr:PilZ domain-containing protein [Candidatus Baltobacteraceae bacterium]
MTGQAGQRRSERILLDVPVVICGGSAEHPTFREETFTVTVSAHGALLMLATKVALGQKVIVMNPQNWDEREARVAYLGPDRAGLAQAGVEFLAPAPEFWVLDDPPANWNLPKTTVE